jgi:glycosyltransferase involved in cell wall biosynthesis
MNDIKTVLISSASLPHEGIASWTTELNYLLQRDNEIDYVIGPITTIKIEKPVQVFIDNISFLDKVKRKFEYRNRFNPYIRALKKVLKREDKIILQIKDNFGLLKAILYFINKNKLRERVYIQYHYHSYMPFSADESLLSQIDELVLLTTASYQKIKEATNTFPVRVSINNDGVDSSVFKPVDKKTKVSLRKELNINLDSLIFIWCSQDRKKKGIDLTLEIWERLYANNQDISLLVFGLNKEIHANGVQNMGRIPNAELVKYYQLSDFYLFPTLCQEGFGLSLTEALKCGSYCIASNFGATPFILCNGAYGKLIKRPNIIDDWIEVIEESITDFEINNRKNPFLKAIPKEYLDMKDWYFRYNQIIIAAKKSFKFRYYI